MLFILADYRSGWIKDLRNSLGVTENARLKQSPKYVEELKPHMLAISEIEKVVVTNKDLACVKRMLMR